MRAPPTRSILALAGLLAMPASAQWTSIDGPNGKYVYALVPKWNELHAGTDRGLFVSADGGGRWTAARKDVEVLEARKA